MLSTRLESREIWKLTDRRIWNLEGILEVSTWIIDDYWDICWIVFLGCKVSSGWNEASSNAELVAKIDRNLRQQVSTWLFLSIELLTRIFEWVSLGKFASANVDSMLRLRSSRRKLRIPGAAMGSIVEKHGSEESSKLNVPCNRTTSSMPKKCLCDRDVKDVGVCEWIKA